MMIATCCRPAVFGECRQCFASLGPAKITGVGDERDRALLIDRTTDAFFVHHGEGETGLRDRAVAARAHETARRAIVARGDRALRKIETEVGACDTDPIGARPFERRQCTGPRIFAI